jgi:hypothetical protein
MHPAFTTIVDYAGLFPPASCSMDDAVAHYARYRESGDRWMLGRFVVPATRLGELAGAVARTELPPAPDDPWELSEVLGAEHVTELAHVAELAAGRLGGVLRTAAVEVRIGTVAEVPRVAERVAGAWEVFLEVPHLTSYDAFLESIKAVGGMAKIRMGGVSAEAFPDADVVSAFLDAAVRHGVPFKATAGLHHPWRGAYPMTYAPGAATATMFGYAAVLVATAALRSGAGVEVARAILIEDDPTTFRSVDGCLAWRDRQFTGGDLAAARRLAFRGFGSCSFREPVEELALEVGA